MSDTDNSRVAKSSSSSYRHILKYTSLFGGVQGLSILLAIVRNKLVATLLGKAGMGFISLLNSTIKLVSDSTNLGLSMSAVKHVSACYGDGEDQDTPADEDSFLHAVMLIRFWSLLVGLFGMVVCIVFSPLLDRITFDWGDHVLHFILLSPVVFMTAVTGGELTILKGTRRLKQLARISIYGIIGALLTTVPIYYFFRMSGVVPSLIIIALIQMVITLGYSYHYYPLHLEFSISLLREGLQMVRLGLAFVLSSVMASGADFIIRAYFNKHAGLDVVGLYNAGYMITIIYGGMLFSAMDSDYFPRLSSLSAIDKQFHDMVSRQIEVSLLITGPMVAALIVGMPILLPLLYAKDFADIIGMAQLAAFSLLLRAVYLPMEYISLSRGDSHTFFVQEFFSCAMLVVGVITGYALCGLNGIGWGIIAGSVIECLFVLVYTRIKYCYHISRKAVFFMLTLTTLTAVTYASIRLDSQIAYWCAGSTAVMLSCLFSWKMLKGGFRETQS